MGMAITSALLAYGLDSRLNTLSASAIILFIVSIVYFALGSQLTAISQVSFAIGLGPVPFLLVSEVVPSPVRVFPHV